MRTETTQAEATDVATMPMVSTRAPATRAGWTMARFGGQLPGRPPRTLASIAALVAAVAGPCAAPVVAQQTQTQPQAQSQGGLLGALLNAIVKPQRPTKQPPGTDVGAGTGAGTGSAGGVQQPVFTTDPSCRRFDVRSFAVAGVKLGMTPVEVRTALAAGGFRITGREGETPSFESRVAAKVAERTNGKMVVAQTTGSLSATGADTQAVDVEFLPTQTGPKASRVEYRIDQSRLTWADFLGRTAQRYGPWSHVHEAGMTRAWFSPAEPQCNVFAVREEAALEARQLPAGPITLTLVSGRRAQAAWEQSIAAEIERRAPRGVRTSF